MLGHRSNTGSSLADKCSQEFSQLLDTAKHGACNNTWGLASVVDSIRGREGETNDDSRMYVKGMILAAISNVAQSALQQAVCTEEPANECFEGLKKTMDTNVMEFDLTNEDNDTRKAFECMSFEDFCGSKRLDKMNKTVDGWREDSSFRHHVFKGLRRLYALGAPALVEGCCQSLQQCCTNFTAKEVLPLDNDLAKYAAVIAVSRYFVGLEDKIRDIIHNMTLLKSQLKINIGMDDDVMEKTKDCTSALTRALATPKRIREVDLQILLKRDNCDFTGNPVAAIELKGNKYILPYRVLHTMCMEDPQGELCARSTALLVARQELRRSFPDVPACDYGKFSWECT